MRARHWLSVLVPTLLLAAACSSSDTSPTGTSAPLPPAETVIEGAAVVDPAWLLGRKLEFLRFETQTFAPQNPINVLAHLTRKRLEPGYAPPGPAPDDAWDGTFAGWDALRDGRDFSGLYVLAAILGFEGDPMISPALRAKSEAALTRFKYWYTDPTPPGLTDNSYYWSENHQLLFHTIEHLVGLRFPDRPIGTDGKTGKEHADRAAKMIVRWLEHRLRYGFAEWHSNVYYQKDLTPLLVLVEHARDPAIVHRAAAVLDVLCMDLALHTLRDAFGVTHGRSYKKDKMKSTDEDTWSFTKLVFASSTYDWDKGGDPGATIFSASTKYAMPELVRRAGAAGDTMVVRERMGLPMPESPPTEAEPVAPDGLSYTSADDLPIWWGMGALTAWPVVPLTLETFNTYNLWDVEDFAPFKQLRSITPDLGKNLSAYNAAMLNFGLMRDVDTYTYRNADVMLSSAVDYRKGTFNQQVHAWQATLDARAIVFTNHPFRPLATTGDWRDDPESGGYWNGEASMPRSAQADNVAIHIYAPQYAITNEAPFDYFRYEPYTHAYFPQEYFDEIAQRGPWTFGRLGKGYVALYSFRPAKFLTYDPKTQATDGRLQPFDLRADGGADNVWISEVGREAEWGSFAAFVDAVSAAKVEVTSRGPGKPSGERDGFDVAYTSPSRGLVTFGWEAPLVAAGAPIPLQLDGRHESPFGRVPRKPGRVVFERDGYAIDIDVTTGVRRLRGPR